MALVTIGAAPKCYVCKKLTIPILGWFVNQDFIYANDIKEEKIKNFKSRGKNHSNESKQKCIWSMQLMRLTRWRLMARKRFFCFVSRALDIMANLAIGGQKTRFRSFCRQLYYISSIYEQSHYLVVVYLFFFLFNKGN